MASSTARGPFSHCCSPSSPSSSSFAAVTSLVPLSSDDLGSWGSKKSVVSGVKLRRVVGVTQDGLGVGWLRQGWRTRGYATRTRLRPRRSPDGNKTRATRKTRSETRQIIEPSLAPYLGCFCQTPSLGLWAWGGLPWLLCCGCYGRAYTMLADRPDRETGSRKRRNTSCIHSTRT